MKKRITALAALGIATLCVCLFCLWEQAPSKGQQEGLPVEPYRFPAETQTHEGTWLVWPHAHTYGKAYLEEVEPIWIEMVSALHAGENVHIIAYSRREEARIRLRLEQAGVNGNQIDFVIAKSDDVWARDTGPMFVFDKENRLTILDFAFDGWGKKTPFRKDRKIPQAVAQVKDIPLVEVSDFVLEGGSVELDGNGTAMLCKSSVISQSRNPGVTTAEAEAVLSQYLGVTNYIWLEGVGGEDITDGHIDGMARFFDEKTILSVSAADFLALYEGSQASDYHVLTASKNAQGTPYQIITLPMTQKNVKGLDYKGNYLNFYVGNTVLLLPVYQDSNDAVAIAILSGLYRDKTVVPIDVTALYQYGGMLHCITQQQPLRNNPE